MIHHPSLHELIRMTGNGDPSAFDTLCARMRQPLLRQILWRYSPTLTKEDAEDVIQNTFIKVLLHASDYGGAHDEASAKNWIFTIARREALKVIATSNRSPVSLDGLREYGHESDDDPAVPERSVLSSDLNWEGEGTVENRTARAGILERIFSSIQRLSVEERRMLVLRFGYEYTFEDLGKDIGRSKPRAKQIIDGLIERMRNALGKDFFRD